LTLHPQGVPVISTMVAHLTDPEKELIDKIARSKNGTVGHALAAVNAGRARKGKEEMTRSPVYRYMKGLTYKRAAPEKRGRKPLVTKGVVRDLQQARRRLLKKADSEERVTYADIQEEAGYKGTFCEKTMADALRNAGVSFKKPRRKIGLTKEDAKERKLVGKVWVKRPTSYWTKRVKCYYDNKTFPLPLTAKQRKKFKQTRITGHLRLPGEGVEQGFTKPRTDHCWIGIPSVTIAAAVAKDRVIMWHNVGKKWNGAVAAGVYKGPMLKALRRTWGHLGKYTIVEDGDRKGNQSGKGKTAKKECHIHSVTLPPRTPCWMPLDYAIWKKVMDKVVSGMPKGEAAESKEEYLKRLKKAAMSLPRGFVANSIKRMKKNIQGVLDAKGYHPKCD